MAVVKVLALLGVLIPGDLCNYFHDYHHYGHFYDSYTKGKSDHQVRNQIFFMVYREKWDPGTLGPITFITLTHSLRIPVPAPAYPIWHNKIFGLWSHGTHDVEPWSQGPRVPSICSKIQWSQQKDPMVLGPQPWPPGSRFQTQNLTIFPLFMNLSFNWAYITSSKVYD